MKLIKKILAISAALALFALPVHQAQGAVTSYDGSGGGYTSGSDTASMAPFFALGTIAAVALIAILVSNQSHSSGHGHSH